MGVFRDVLTSCFKGSVIFVRTAVAGLRRERIRLENYTEKIVWSKKGSINFSHSNALYTIVELDVTARKLVVVMASFSSRYPILNRSVN